MFGIKNKKIKTNLSLLTLVPSAAFIIFEIWVILTVNSFLDIQEQIYKTGDKVRAISTDLINPLNQLREKSMSMVMAPDDNFRKEISKDFLLTIQIIEKNIDSLKKGNDFKNTEVNMNNILQMWEQYRKLCELTVKYIENGYREAAFINASTAEREQFKALTDKLELWQKQAVEKALETYSKGSQKGSNTFLFTILIGFSALMLMLFLYSGIKRLLGAEPWELSDIANHIANGEIEFQFRDKQKQDTGVYSDMKKWLKTWKIKSWQQSLLHQVI
ncbi:Uncharacterized protein dnl_34420 [Desulfonema limicola]|uniref:Chemotaxis methyl-accepting receptor HlyB-like 4HB MCP domain-containing protein n=1 Tax=Desulfonema limicola TaxID=45656 RepID=A0A975B979_9BACT|nr:hypothetical protein [Desulfonema limicola]QTA81115.1 Uncharacterized protein dnl_34420 [Desulfonema limicola]